MCLKTFVRFCAATQSGFERKEIRNMYAPLHMSLKEYVRGKTGCIRGWLSMPLFSICLEIGDQQPFANELVTQRNLEYPFLFRKSEARGKFSI